MKRLFLLSFSIAVLAGMSLNSCKKDDDFTLEKAMRLQNELDMKKQAALDSLQSKNSRVNYTVNLVDASTSTLKSGSSGSSVAGAKVKFVQDTTILIQHADTAGVITFSNLKPGLANINISLEGFSQVTYTVNLASTAIDGGRQISNIIPMIPLSGTSTGTIKGKIVCETDLTNTLPEVAPLGTKVLLMIKTNSKALSTPANLVSISYNNLSLSAVTDENGEFIMKVPATVLGLEYDIIVSDFTTTQKLLLNEYQNRDTFGVLSVPTSFGSSFISPSEVYSGKAVLVTIDAPNYTFSTENTATAEAVVDNPDGIAYIQNTNVGSFYADGYYSFTIINPLTNTEAENASIPFNVVNGHINANPTNNNHIYYAGAGFPKSFEGSEVIIPYIVEPSKAIVDEVNENGAIVKYHVALNKTGKFYSYKNLYFTKHTGNGTGLITDLPNINTGKHLYFSTSSKTLYNPIGTGFAVGDSLILSVNNEKKDEYEGKVHMTTGQVTAINLSKEGSNYISGQVDVVIDSPVTGTTATAVASVVDGKISKITLKNFGSGYSSNSVPKVTIINKVENIRAKYEPVLSNEGQIMNFIDLNQGNGYLSVPNVTISPAIPGTGAGASAYATISSGKVTSLTLTSKGTGYRGNIPSKEKAYSGPSSIEVRGDRTTILNIDLGTGKRNFE